MNYEISNIESIECIGEFNDYVYDIEMEDDTEHTFFANDILVHNSVYFTILPILNKLNMSVNNKECTLNHDVYKIAD